MTRLVTALLVRNEADRHLQRVLERCKTFSDALLVLDDGSTDATADVARAAGAIVHTLGDTGGWWGAGEHATESHPRQRLWELAAAEAGKGGWVLVCDADMLFMGDPRPLTLSWDVNAWAFVLYDAWSPTEFRYDGYWQGHVHPRPWLFCPSRVPPDFAPTWSGRALHAGHAPANFPVQAGIADPTTHYYIHLAYATADDRRRKHAQYLARPGILTDWESAHARSIVDGDALARPTP